MRFCMFVHSSAALLAGLLPVYADGQTLPRGYETIQVTENAAYEFFPRINNSGQIVFTHWPDVSNRQTEEIFLYDGLTGELTQITDDNVQDVSPDINDAGVICWSRGIGPVNPDSGEPTTEIVMRDPDGTITRLTDNDQQEFGSRINNVGVIAWYRYTGFECGLTSDIWMFDRKSVRAVTTDSVRDRVSHQAVELNDLNELVWTRYDFCAPPPGYNFTSKIMMFSAGEIFEVTDGHAVPQSPDLNNLSQVVWQYFDSDSNVHTIDLWERGVTSTLVVDGDSPAINDSAEVAFMRIVPSVGIEVRLLRGEQLFLLTEPGTVNLVPDINNASEVAWGFGDFPGTDITYLRRFDRGDLNCDGSIDAFDIEPFIFALFDPTAYLDRYPNCDPMLADLDRSGAVDAFDIEPFLTILFE